MKLNKLEKLTINHRHNAFTDLCFYQSAFYCCYREASHHVSSDGIIRILKLDDQGKKTGNSFIRMANCDLRDPKLTVSPDGKLILLAYVKEFNLADNTFICRNRCWVSQDGLSWSTAKIVAQTFWWLWRIRWDGTQAYGFAYNRRANAIDLYQGDPRRTFHKSVAGALSLHSHQLGYPNESDLVFSNKQCFAIVRRDADSFSAQLGRSQFPYRKWSWQDLGFYLGGPVMLLLDEQTALLAGRVVYRHKLKTAIFTLRLSTGVISEKLILPSAGDNSYPGMVLHNGQLYLSYYSSHEDNNSAVYLAQITL